jgi:hypothetical protein
LTPRCLTCNARIETTSDLFGDAEIKAGDVSICLYCGAVALFTGNGNEVRYPSHEELGEILSDPSVQLARAVRKVVDTPSPTERQ